MDEFFRWKCLIEEQKRGFQETDGRLGSCQDIGSEEELALEIYSGGRLK
jgi:hypothetical protein